MVLPQPPEPLGGAWPMLRRVPAFAWYLVAGLGSSATDFSVYTVLAVGAGVDPLITNLISRPLGGMTCFYLNRTWTFRSTGPVVGQLARFWCVFGASLALTEGLLALFCKAMGLGPLPGKLLAEGIALVFNFLALKHWTFGTEPSRGRAAEAGRGAAVAEAKEALPIGRAGPSSLLVAALLVGAALRPLEAEITASLAVAPGLEYARHEESGNIAHVITMDLGAKGLSIRSVKSQGKETIRQLAERMDGTELTVLAGINGDFFRQDSAAGLPYGVQVSDGRLVFAPMKRTMIGFGPRNEPFIGIVSLRAGIVFASSASRSRMKWATIDDINPMESEIEGKSGIYLYTPAFLGLKMARPNGLIAVVESIDPALQVGDVCEGKVARIETSAKPVDVPEAGCLLHFAGEAARALATGVKPGQPVSLRIELPPITGGVSQAIGGGPRLVRGGSVSVELSKEVFDGVHAMEISKRHPRSAIGHDRGRRNLYLVMVEGRHERSRGMTFGELAAFLVKIGCHEAMAFDGGGSAGMFLEGKGLVSMSMGGQNRPEEREVANGLLITMPKALAVKRGAEKAAGKTKGTAKAKAKEKEKGAATAKGDEKPTDPAAAARKGRGQGKDEVPGEGSEEDPSEDPELIDPGEPKPGEDDEEM